jgi:hypothetical protein
MVFGVRKTTHENGFAAGHQSQAFAQIVLENLRVDDAHIIQVAAGGSQSRHS